MTSGLGKQPVSNLNFSFDLLTADIKQVNVGQSFSLRSISKDGGQMHGGKGFYVRAVKEGGILPCQSKVY